MKHEQETIKILQTFADQHREAAAFTQDFARIAIEAAAQVAALVRLCDMAEVHAQQALTAWKTLCDAAQRDAQRIGEETRKSIALAAPHFTALYASLPGRAIAGEAFARMTQPVTSHLERII